jgi:hypothetical protein
MFPSVFVQAVWVAIDLMKNDIVRWLVEGTPPIKRKRKSKTEKISKLR